MKDNKENNLAENLRSLRFVKGYHLEQIGETVGATRQTVSKWEKGIVEPNAEQMVALVALYELPSLDVLVHGKFSLRME